MTRDTRRWALERLGQTVAGRYRVKEVLGAGGMGAVFRAEDLRRSSTVAVKVPLPGSARARAAIRHEADVAEALAGPGIVEVVGLQEDEALGPVLVMERLVGEPLSAHLEAEGPLGHDEATHIARAITETLARVHAAGFVHRDLKPSNVFVTGDGRVVLIDLGIVARIGEAQALAPLAEDMQSTPREQTGEVFVLDAKSGAQPASRWALVGTPWYMAPEVVSGGSPDPQTDVYALGALLYEMLTGVRPYEALGRDEVLRGITEGPPSAIRALRADVPKGLEETVERAMARSRAARFPDAAELAAALSAGLPSRRRVTRRSTLLWLSGAGVAAAGAVAAASLARSGGGSMDKRADDAPRPAVAGQLIAYRRGERFVPASVVAVSEGEVEALLLYDTRVTRVNGRIVFDPFTEGTEVVVRGDREDTVEIATVVSRVGDAVLLDDGLSTHWRSIVSVEATDLVKRPARGRLPGDLGIHTVGARVLVAPQGPELGFYPGTLIGIEEERAHRVVLAKSQVVVCEDRHVRPFAIPRGGVVRVARADDDGAFHEENASFVRRDGHALLVQGSAPEPYWTSDAYLAVYASTVLGRRR